MRRVPLTAGLFLLLLLATVPAGAFDDTPALSNFASAQVVIGQGGFASGDCNRGGNPAADGFCGPEGAGALGKGKRYLPDSGNSRVLGFSKLPQTNGVSAAFVLGQTDFMSSKFAVGQASFSFPSRAATSGNQLFVADFSNSRVLIWNKLPSSTAQPADVVVGQPNFSSKVAATTQSGLNLPESGVIAVKGMLFVSDRNNNRVMIWNHIPKTNGANADVVIGQPNFTSNGSDTTQTSFAEPEGLWSDGKRLAVADFDNNRVMIWNHIPTTNGAPADVVVGQPDFVSFDSADPPNAQSLRQPGDVASDGKRLFVADSRNNRILVYSPFPTANNATASVVLGQADFAHGDANAGSMSPSAQTLSFPFGIQLIRKQLLANDFGNSRFLLFSAK